MTINSEVSKPPLEGGRTSYFKMFSLGIIVVLPNILAGMSECYSSIALPDMNLEVNAASWFASVGGYTGLVGILLIGLIIDAFGRKSTLLLGVVPHIIGWTLLSWQTTTILVLIIGRALTGLTAISMFYAPQVYAVECITVNHATLRSNFRVWPGVANSIGSLLTFFGGTFLTHQQVAAFAAILSAFVFALIYALIPESPAWLHQRGRIGDAEISEQQLGIAQPILQRTMDATSQSPQPKMWQCSWSSIRLEVAKLCRRDIYIPVIVMSMVCALIMLTGGVVLNAYMVDIMGVDAANQSATTANSRNYSVVSGLLILVAHLCVSAVLPYAGCRKMCIWMGILMAAGMVILGATTNVGGTSNTYPVHVAAVWLVTFSFHLGVLSVPVAVMSDLFPVDAKGFACIAILTLSFCGALVVQTYLFLSAYFGGGVFYGYAAVCLVYATFVYFFMPETVGRTYEQIRDNLLR